MHFYFPVPLPYTFSSSPGRERHPATLQTKPPGCRARPPPRQAAPRPPAAPGPLTPSKRMNRGLSGSSDHPGGPPPAPARRDTARRHRHHRGLPPVPAPLTQQQPGLHDADLEVGAEVLHVSAAAAGRRRRLLLLHLQAGAAPRLDDPPACQRRYAGALLPQVGPGEAADLLGKGVHGPDTHRRSPRDSRPDRSPPQPRPQPQPYPLRLPPAAAPDDPRLAERGRPPLAAGPHWLPAPRGRCLGAQSRGRAGRGRCEVMVAAAVAGPGTGCSRPVSLWDGGLGPAVTGAGHRGLPPTRCVEPSEGQVWEINSLRSVSARPREPREAGLWWGPSQEVLGSVRRFADAVSLVLVRLGESSGFA